MDKPAFLAALAMLGLDLDEQALAKFENFEEELYIENEVTNLTRIPREECWLRHFVDSLLFQDLLLPGDSVLDIGSGPGFPAFPLACARPDLTVTSLDSSGKTTGFLRHHPLPNLTVVTGRAEEWGVRELYDVVTGRALAPFGIQMELSAPACAVGGRVIPMRTPQDRGLFESAAWKGLGLRFVSAEERVLTGTDIVRVFPVYEKVSATPSQYPRTWAEIKKRPLA